MLLTGLRLLGFQQPLGAEQVQQAAGAVELLVDLGTGGAGAKMTTTAIMFHRFTSLTLDSIDGIPSICQEITTPYSLTKASPDLTSAARSGSSSLPRSKPSRTALPARRLPFTPWVRQTFAPSRATSAASPAA